MAALLGGMALDHLPKRFGRFLSKAPPMEQRPRLFVSPGRFEIMCHQSPPRTYPEEEHGTIQVCVPLRDAAYRVRRTSETGRRLVHDLGADDVLVVPVGQPHAVTWRRTAGIVSLQLATTFVAESLGVERIDVPDRLTVRDPFVSLAAAELQTVMGGGAIGATYADALAVTIAYRIGAAARLPVTRRARAAAAFTARERRAIDQYLEEHLAEAVTLDHLAALVACSRWHLVRRFQASYGCAPHEYLARRRLARAKTLLIESDRSITTIALEVGWTHSHFSRVFFERFGRTPRAFRGVPAGSSATDA